MNPTSLRKPLADRLRPKTLERVVGQSHLLSEGMLIHQLFQTKQISNLIFYGPSGTGKSTIAILLAQNSNKPLYRINATNAGVKELKEVIEALNHPENQNGIILYLDEIQHFNKKQQQLLLPYLESGEIILLSSTTENPYFTIFSAILSRSTLVEFKPLTIEDCLLGLTYAIEFLNAEEHYQITYEETTLLGLARQCNGDLRIALNTLDLICLTQFPHLTWELTPILVEHTHQSSGFSYDKFGDQHYDTLSAFQKSIRGSDIQASLYYLARLIKANDMISICRRLLVIASEDIGLAHPQALELTKHCVDTANQVGFPEARFALAQATIYLASCPKSNSISKAIDKALSDVDKFGNLDIPSHLKDSHYAGSKTLGRGVDYLYPHDYPHHYVKQSYLPPTLLSQHYYEFGDNSFEQQIKKFMDYIKQ